MFNVNAIEISFGAEFRLGKTIVKFLPEEEVVQPVEADRKNERSSQWIPIPRTDRELTGNRDYVNLAGRDVSRLEGHAERERLEVRLAIGARENVGQIARVRAVDCLEAVLAVLGVEVAARGLEGRLALAGLVDVKRVLARRQTRELDCDEHAARRLLESGGAEGLTVKPLECVARMNCAFVPRSDGGPPGDRALGTFHESTSASLAGL